MARQTNTERGPMAQPCTVRVDAAPVQHGNLPREPQTESKPPITGRTTATRERLEDGSQVLRGDAGSGVRHGDGDGIVLTHHFTVMCPPTGV
jgi:hypothetical protein